MRIKQVISRKPGDNSQAGTALQGFTSDLLLVFGSVDHFTHPEFADNLRQLAPQAILLGCSTAGEITPDGVEDGTCTLTAIDFANVGLQAASTELHGMDDSFAAGERLGQQLAAPDLKAVLLFGPGVQINGSALVNGIASIIGTQVPVTGGLAGDGGAFKQTYTLGPAGVSSKAVVAVGLHGNSLRFGHGSFGG